ncbi:amidohydrolase [Ramlibacter sp. AW1]|uniref:Amidohydrolase n=1 Tax=Ramlibacter aurantiacus TaxID=2801330 RepID=A0A936ZGP1_9BURK|nr:amidohydrolase family protein [Ramlibacter aurantiacus]MBL0419923.1 amidohydrolase [Ramlibacter aurantiacus]
MSPPRPLLFDSHAHLVADDQVRYPRQPMQRAADAPYRPPGVIGRPGGHHGPHPINEVPDASRMLRWMAEENVDGAVAVQKRMIYRYDNSYILDSSDAHPDTFLAVVILDAEDPATPETVRRWVGEHGLTGLRLFGGRKADGSMPWLNSPQALESWKAIDDAGLVMELEVLAQGGGGPSIPAILELAEQFPHTRIVLDHLLEPEMDEGGHFGLDERYERMAGHPRIFFKFTSINLDTCRETGIAANRLLRRAVDLFGADHLMWGSDIGTSSGTYKDMVQRMVDASDLLNPDEQRAVWHDTGRRVFFKPEAGSGR